MEILKRTEVRLGSVMGLILGGVLALNAFGIYYLNTRGVITILPCVVAYFYTGYKTGQRVRTTMAGAVAGFLTGIISSLVSTIAVLFVVSTHLDSMRQRLQVEAVTTHQLIHYTNDQVLNQQVLGVVAGLVLASLVGTTIGMQGAKMGLKRRRAQP